MLAFGRVFHTNRYVELVYYLVVLVGRHTNKNTRVMGYNALIAPALILYTNINVRGKQSMYIIAKHSMRQLP